MKQTHSLFNKIKNFLILSPKIKASGMRNSVVLGAALTFLANPMNSDAQIVNTESFDGTTFVPAGWTNLNTSGSNAWTRETAGTFPTQAPQSGAGEAKFDSWNANGGVRSLITPAFALTNNTSGAAVSFWMYRDAGYSTSADKIDVFYNTAANLAGAVLLGTVNRSSALTPTVAVDGWYQYFYSIPNTVTSSNAYLILRGTSTYGNNIYIDNVSWTSYPNICSGTPAIPTSSISTAVGCPSALFSINTSGATNALGITFQWQASNAMAGTYSAIPGATTTAYSSNVSLTTYYRMVTTCSVSTLSSTTSVQSYSVNNPGPCVCTTYGASGATSTSDEEILGFAIGTMTNASNCSVVAPGPGSSLNLYANYAGHVAPTNACIGAAIPFTLNVGTCVGFYGVQCSIYIDYNQNGSFGDAGELAYSNTNISTAGNVFGSVTIPATALPGLTRVRVILVEGTVPGPTGTYLWGETEDYCITILSPPTILLGANSGSICPGIPFTTAASGANTYTINGGPGILSGSSISLTPIANTTYSISGTALSGCRSLPSTNATATITTLASPAITVSVVSPSMCPGISNTLTLTGANTYTWASPASNASVITINPLSTTVYTVAGTGTTVCNGITNFTVFVYPTPTISVNSNTLCAGRVFTTTPSMLPGGTPTFTYSNGSNTIAPTTNTTINVTGTSTNGCISAGPVVASVTVFTLPVVTVNSATLCNGSQFVMVPSGATSYTFINSGNPVTPSVTTTYSVIGSTTVGCASLPALATATVYSLPTLTVVATPSNLAVCENSTLTLTASGASSYNWNNTTTGATFMNTPSVTSSYFVLGTDANGCVGVASVPFTVNPQPAVALSGNTFVCSGASSTLTTTGGVTYSWTVPGTGTNVVVSPAATTVYGVTGTGSNGCIRTVTLTVAVNTIVVTASSNTAVCLGKDVTLLANGATSYTWLPIISVFNPLNITPLVTATYTYLAKDSKQCIHTGMIVVTVNPLPVINLAATSQTICAGETTTITATGGSSYDWTAPTATTGAMLVVNPNVNTTYNVTGTDVNGCSGNATTRLTVSKCTGLEKIGSEITGLNVFPNPTNGEFTVELNNGLNKTIEVSDLTGRVIVSSQTQDTKTVVNLNNFANGVYYVKIQSNNSVEVIKVVKH